MSTACSDEWTLALPKHLFLGGNPKAMEPTSPLIVALGGQLAVLTLMACGFCLMIGFRTGAKRLALLAVGLLIGSAFIVPALPPDFLSRPVTLGGVIPISASGGVILAGIAGLGLLWLFGAAGLVRAIFLFLVVIEAVLQYRDLILQYVPWWVLAVGVALVTLRLLREAVALIIGGNAADGMAGALAADLFRWVFVGPLRFGRRFLRHLVER